MVVKIIHSIVVLTFGKKLTIDLFFTFLIIPFQTSSPTQYFWYRSALDISDDIENPDNFNFAIAGCLLAAWALVYLCIVKGITENPKIIYVTAIYPYVVLVIFFFRGITLEGMEHGIAHLFKPKVCRRNTLHFQHILNIKKYCFTVGTLGRSSGVA